MAQSSPRHAPNTAQFSFYVTSDINAHVSILVLYYHNLEHILKKLESSPAQGNDKIWFIVLSVIYFADSTSSWQAFRPHTCV